MLWLKFWPAVVSRFVQKSGFIHASSLSYTTLVGMIPVLAVGLSVATSLMVKEGDEGRAEVEAWIDTMVKTIAPMLDLEVRDYPGSKSSIGPIQDQSGEGFPSDDIWNHATKTDNITEMVEEANNGPGGRRREVARQIAEFVSKIHTRTIGMTSVCVFLVVAIMLLRAIERTFNQIWEIPKNRSWGAGVAQYWAGLTLGPIFFVVGTGLSSSSTLQDFSVFISGMRWFGKVLLFAFSWVITGSACALVYRIMTNTRVTLRAAAAGGLSAGLLLQLNSQLSVVYFFNVATVNKIYGSLGAIPILLLGLYVSWIILIFGSHLAYLVQFPTKDFGSVNPSEDGRANLSSLEAVRLLQIVAERFKIGKSAFTRDELSEKLGTDLGVISEAVDVFVEGGFLFLGSDPDARVTLAKPAESISLAAIYQLIEQEERPHQALSGSDVCWLAHSKILAIRNKSASEIFICDLVQMQS